jgi:hypothetical protein
VSTGNIAGNSIRDAEKEKKKQNKTKQNIQMSRNSHWKGKISTNLKEGQWKSDGNLLEKTG